MSYYKICRIGFNKLESEIKNATRLNGGVELELLLYNLTKELPISEKALKGRLEKMERLDIIENCGGLLTWKGKLTEKG